MEKPRYIKIILIVLGVAFFFTVIVHISKSLKEDFKNVKTLQNEYPKADILVSLSGIIVSIDSLKGVSLIKLNSGDAYRFPFSKNYHYKPPELVRFFEIGDSIMKNSSSDTLYIFRERGKAYFFILGKYVGEN